MPFLYIVFWIVALEQPNMSAISCILVPSATRCLNSSISMLTLFDIAHHSARYGRLFHRYTLLPELYTRTNPSSRMISMLFPFPI